MDDETYVDWDSPEVMVSAVIIDLDNGDYESAKKYREWAIRNYILSSLSSVTREEAEEWFNDFLRERMQQEALFPYRCNHRDRVLRQLEEMDRELDGVSRESDRHAIRNMAAWHIVRGK